MPKGTTKKKKRKRKKTEKKSDPFEFPARKKRKRTRQPAKSKKLSQQEEELRKAKQELAEQRKKKKKESGSLTSALEQPFLTQSQRAEKPKRKRHVKRTPVQFPLLPNVGEPSPMKSIEERERLSPIISSQGAFFSDDEDLEDFKILTGPAFQDENDENQNIKEDTDSQSEHRQQRSYQFDEVEERSPNTPPSAPHDITEPFDPLDDSFDVDSIILRSPDLKKPIPFADLRSPDQKVLKVNPPRKKEKSTPLLRTPLSKRIPVIDLDVPEAEDAKKKEPEKRSPALDISKVDISALSQPGYSASRKSKRKRKRRKKKEKEIVVDPIIQKKAKQEMEQAIQFYKSVDSMDISDCFIVEVQK